MTDVSDSPIEPDARDAAMLIPSLAVLDSLVRATIDSPAAAPILLDQLDALIEQASGAPPVDLTDDAEPSCLVLLSRGLVSIAGPGVSVDVVDTDGARSAAVSSGGVLCSTARGPAVETLTAPLTSGDDTIETSAGDDVDQVGATVQIVRDGETVVDVAIDHRGRIIDRRDVDGVMAAWTGFYERELAAAMQTDEAGLGEFDDDDAELVGVWERVSERAERRRQEVAEADVADAADAGATDLLAPPPAPLLAPPPAPLPAPTWVATRVVPDGGTSVWPAPSVERDPGRR